MTCNGMTMKSSSRVKYIPQHTEEYWSSL